MLAVRLALSALLVSAFLQLACAGGSSPAGPSAGPEAHGSRPLQLPPAQLPRGPVEGEFLLRQTLRFAVLARDPMGGPVADAGVLDAVVQAHCGKLSIVGLTPIGTRLFTIELEDGQIESQSFMNRPWPFPPDHIVEDVYRTYLIPNPEPAPRDETVEREIAGLRVTERWQGGRLIERRIPNAPDGRSTRISYSYARASDVHSRSVELIDEVDGYRLQVETRARESLECSNRVRD